VRLRGSTLFGSPSCESPSEAEEKLADLRERDPVTRGLLIDGKTNPLVKISRTCATELSCYVGSERLPCRAGAAPAPRAAAARRRRRVQIGEAGLGDWSLQTQLDGCGRRCGSREA
jgi:hypothetical protein